MMQAITASCSTKRRGTPVPLPEVNGTGIRIPDAAQCWTLRGFAPDSFAKSVMVRPVDNQRTLLTVRTMH